MKEHTHTCEACHVVFECLGVGRREVCEVDTSAQANGSGPFCERCRCGIMFIRYTEAMNQEPALWIHHLHAFDHGQPL